jgi:hypothetical protein
MDYREHFCSLFCEQEYNYAKYFIRIKKKGAENNDVQMRLSCFGDTIRVRNVLQPYKKG